MKRKYTPMENEECYTKDEKRKMEVLDKCEIKVEVTGRTTKEDYEELKDSARKEVAKKSSTSSKSQIIYCLQESFGNRYL